MAMKAFCRTFGLNMWVQVEKRFGLGWTINFGQTRAWELIALALAPLGFGFAFVMSIAS